MRGTPYEKVSRCIKPCRPGWLAIVLLFRKLATAVHHAQNSYFISAHGVNESIGRIFDKPFSGVRHSARLTRSWECGKVFRCIVNALYIIFYSIKGQALTQQIIG